MFTLLATDSNEDLALYNSELLVLKRESNEVPEAKWLKYKNIWFLTDKHQSCSCGFRYVESPNVDDLWFGNPEDWFPEDETDIEATHQIYKIIKSLLGCGALVESVSTWADSNPQIKELSVNLNEIGIESFRFFDGYIFKYECNT